MKETIIEVIVPVEITHHDSVPIDKIKKIALEAVWVKRISGLDDYGFYTTNDGGKRRIYVVKTDEKDELNCG